MVKNGAQAAMARWHVSHGRCETVYALGDLRLGLDPAEVVGALRRAGFEDVHTESAPDRYCPRSGDEPARRASLPLYLVRGRAPGRTPDVRNPLS